MPSTSSQLDSAALGPVAGAAVGPRVSVLDIFQRHIGSLSRLPGEISQFEETGVGYEWRCQMDLGSCPSGHALRNVPCTLQLQFSLIDLDGRSQPVAVLYLVEQACDSAWQERALMSLSNPQALHEQISASLLPLTPDTEVLDRAALFVGALVIAKAAIGSEVDWVQAFSPDNIIRAENLPRGARSWPTFQDLLVAPGGDLEPLYTMLARGACQVRE